MSGVHLALLGMDSNNFIATPTATPAIGGALEGGFYTGLIWNQVTQSATSTAIGTGLKTFTVTDAAPLFYYGQAVEVRSRANPDTARMIGTVIGSIGTTLQVNVTSINGSGTLTDWSIMSRFRVIVSPRSSGSSIGQGFGLENSQFSFKNSGTPSPAATATLTEGFKATQAMVADQVGGALYPAADFCYNLSIGGYTDWYLPARDELELLYRNLKPFTLNNDTATRPNNPTVNYTNLGSIGTGGTSYGLNYNSDPQGVAYTTTVPGQTSVAAFQSFGSESLDVRYEDFPDSSFAFYWSSSVYTNDPTNFTSEGYPDTYAWYHDFRKRSGSVAGRQDVLFKAEFAYVRAVRRSII